MILRSNDSNYLRDLFKLGVRFTPDQNLVAVRRDGNRLVATLRNEYSEEESERRVDQVVVDHGTLPNDELYLALRAGARLDAPGGARGLPSAVRVRRARDARRA